MGIKIVHHGKGYDQLIRSAAVQEDLNRRAALIAAAAGGDEANIYAAPGKNPRVRARAAVVAPLGDPENKMLRALDAGR